MIRGGGGNLTPGRLQWLSVPFPTPVVPAWPLPPIPRSKS